MCRVFSYFQNMWLYLLVAVLCLNRHLTAGQVCQPQIEMLNDGIEGIAEPKIECRIRGLQECIDAISYMSFEKVVPDETWQEALRLYRDQTNQVFPLPGGYTLDSRVNPIFINHWYIMTITDSKIDDSGHWRCKVDDGSGGEYYSEEGTFNIRNSSIDSNQISIARDDSGSFVMTFNYKYTCIIPRVWPAMDITWQIGDVMYTNGTSNNIRNGYVYTIQGSINLRLEDHTKGISCGLKDGDDMIMGSPIHVPPTYLSPARVENVSVSLTDGENSIIQLNCTASGNEVNILWTHNGGDMNKEFDIPELLNISGNYLFGQKTAKLSTATLKASSKLCSLHEDLFGPYECKAQGVQQTQDDNYATVSRNCDGSGIPWWGILLIVIASLGVLCGAGLAIYYLCCRQDNSGKTS